MIQLKPLSEFLKHDKEVITIDDTQLYKRCRVQLHRRGIVLRDEVKGFEIKTKKQQICSTHQFLVAEIDAKVGGYGIVPEQLDGAIVSNHYFLFDIDFSKIDKDYFEIVTNQDEFFQQIKAEGSTNYASIRPKDVFDLKIPYFSIEIQKQIAKEIKECEGKVHSLRLSNTDNISLLDNLKKAILQEAVQGRLVPQDPNDEPATELLKKIKVEKEKLIKEKKIKKEKELPPITKEEIPYELPKGWCWVRLGMVTYQITDGTHHTPTYIPQGIPFMSIKDVSSGCINFSDCKHISVQEHGELIKRCKPSNKDILFCRIGTLGKPILVDTDKEFSIFVSLGLIKYPQNYLCPKFLLSLLKSPTLTDQYDKIKVGGGSHTNKLNLEDMHSVIVPIPPLEEQKRIVDKIESLMKLCDDLDAQIKDNQKNSEMLMESVLREAFNN